MANESVFRRFEGNPIVGPEAVPGANSIFNSAVVRFGGGYVGLFRVDGQDFPMQLHLGRSDDGIKWSIEEKPIKIHCGNDAKPASGYDPRITRIGDEYFATWCYYPAGPGPHIGIGRTKDFRRFDLVSEIAFAYDRNAVLFPEKIKGKYAALHRPSDTGHTQYGDIFYCTSPDLVHWGDHKYVFGPKGWWQSRKVGAGPVPIPIEEGWLMIYHGVRLTCNGFVYCAGGAILDREEPWKVRWRCRRYLLAPTALYETVGDVPNVVFPTAAIVFEDTGQIRLYYGAADTYVAMATAQLGEVIEFIKKYGS